MRTKSNGAIFKRCWESNFQYRRGNVEIRRVADELWLLVAGRKIAIRHLPTGEVQFLHPARSSAARKALREVAGILMYRERNTIRALFADGRVREIDTNTWYFFNGDFEGMKAGFQSFKTPLFYSEGKHA